MKIITKYISREIIKFFLMCQLIFNLLYLIIFFIRKIDNFAEAEVAFSSTVAFFLFQIPTIAQQMIPVAAMISIITVICLMKKNMEIMAMKASGLNIATVFQPIIYISLALSIFSFVLAESIIPYTSSRTNKIWEIEVNKQDQANFYGSTQIWYKSKNNIYWIEYFDIETKTMTKPVFYFFNEQFRLIKKIDCDTCKWENNAWQLENVLVQKPDANEDERYKKYKSLTLKIPETPETFINKMKEPENLSYNQLKKQAEKVKAEGYDNTADLVSLNMKLAFPFITVVLSLLAIPIALWEKLKSIPLAITTGIAACFVLWELTSFAETFGVTGRLPPFFAAWTVNILFAFTGIYMLMNVEK